MAEDEEVEAVARDANPAYDAATHDETREHWRRQAKNYIEALDRVRSRPAGGTEVTDEALVELALAEGNWPRSEFCREKMARSLAAVLPHLSTGGTEGECSTCGGRGWHTAGGNDPMACGRCSAGEAWESGMEGEDHEAGMKAAVEAAVEAVADILDSYEYTKSVDALVLVEAVMSRASDARLRDELVSLGETNHAIVQANGRLLAERDEALARVSPSPVSSTEPDTACTCGHEESDGRSDVLRCPVHGPHGGIDFPDPEGFKRRADEALRVARETTEPDTAKLVEALREIAHYEHATAAGQDLVQYMVKVAREALENQ